jgi:ornithine carbamoyltransferase
MQSQSAFLAHTSFCVIGSDFCSVSVALRFESTEEYEKVAGSYCVDAALMMKAKQKMVVMHPLPR